METVICIASGPVLVIVVVNIAQCTRVVIGGGQVIVQSAATVLYRGWNAVHDMTRGVW